MPLLFAYGINRFSHKEAHINVFIALWNFKLVKKYMYVYWLEFALMLVNFNSSLLQQNYKQTGIAHNGKKKKKKQIDKLH